MYAGYPQALQAQDSRIMHELVEAKYGKDAVRIYRVYRDKESGFHDVCEMTLTVMVQGFFAKKQELFIRKPRKRIFQLHDIKKKNHENQIKI